MEEAPCTTPYTTPHFIAKVVKSNRDVVKVKFPLCTQIVVFVKATHRFPLSTDDVPAHQITRRSCQHDAC